MPQRRNGNSNSQISGYSNNANSASGQQKMNNNSQSMEVSMAMILSCVARLS